jgi:hypothetical protein
MNNYERIHKRGDISNTYLLSKQFEKSRLVVSFGISMAKGKDLASDPASAESRSNSVFVVFNFGVSN